MALKQVIVVRKDIEMGKGKVCAQVAHASLELYKKSKKEELEEWEKQGSKKIVLKATLEEIFEAFQKAKEKGLVVVLIRDKGLTQVEEGTLTCMGVFGKEEEVNKITGEFKLY